MGDAISVFQGRALKFISVESLSFLPSAPRTCETSAQPLRQPMTCCLPDRHQARHPSSGVFAGDVRAQPAGRTRELEDGEAETPVRFIAATPLPVPPYRGQTSRRRFDPVGCVHCRSPLVSVAAKGRRHDEGPDEPLAAAARRVRVPVRGAATLHPCSERSTRLRSRSSAAGLGGARERTRRVSGAMRCS